MTKISVWILILVFTASVAGAQDAATQQQLDKLSGQIQDLLDAQSRQSQRLDELEKEVSDLRDKANTPVVNDYATRDQLARITDEINAVDKRRQDDSEAIAAQIDKLAHTMAATPPSISIHPHTPPPDAGSGSGSDSGGDTTSVPQKGYYYPIKSGDTLGLIAKAYRDQGVKVTKAQIIAANPKMNPNVLIPGHKIFIPDASAK